MIEFIPVVGGFFRWPVMLTILVVCLSKYKGCNTSLLSTQCVFNAVFNHDVCTKLFAEVRSFVCQINFFAVFIYLIVMVRITREM